MGSDKTLNEIPSIMFILEQNIHLAASPLAAVTTAVGALAAVG